MILTALQGLRKREQGTEGGVKNPKKYVTKWHLHCQPGLKDGKEFSHAVYTALSF